MQLVSSLSGIEAHCHGLKDNSSSTCSAKKVLLTLSVNMTLGLIWLGTFTLGR